MSKMMDPPPSYQSGDVSPAIVDQLVFASTIALGWMSAQEMRLGLTTPCFASLCLASALADIGVTNQHIEQILESKK